MAEQQQTTNLSESEANPSFFSRPVVKWAITVLLGALFVLAFLTYLATDLISNKLLDPQLYIEALEENHIYNRIYTELLADPALVEVTTRLLGNVGLEGMADSVYSLAVSTLYLVVPPDTIQTATEGVIVDVTSYLKGETEQLEPRLDLSSRLDEETLEERISGVLQVLLAELIVQSVPVGQDAGSAPDVEALADYAQALSQGQLPDVPPSALASSPDGLSDAERTEVANALLGPVEGEVPPMTRLQVEAALAVDDLPSALAIASRALLGDQVSEAAAQLADDFTNSETFDALAATAIYLEETEEEVIGRLNALRDLVSLLDRRLIPLAIFVAAVSLALIVWIHSDSIVEVLRSAGVTFLVAGGLAVMLWVAVRLYLRAWLPELFEGSQGAVPASLENMIRDVLSFLVADLWPSVWIIALVVAVGGLLLIAISYIRNIAGLFRRLLGPVWRYRRAILVGLAVLFVVGPLVGRTLL